jgi:hypothetical protein
MRLSLVFVALGFSACSSVATHELTLLSPVSEPCKAGDTGCQPTYYSCADLSLTSLRLAVGVFDHEVTTVTCPADLQTGNAKVQVNYQPGGNFYMIDASFVRESETIYIAAGPYPESQATHPWQLLLR